MKSVKLLIVAVLVQFFLGCEKNAIEKTVTDVVVHETDDDYSWDVDSAIPINLNGTSISCTSSSVLISGTKATITTSGEYLISGELENGQIVVTANGEQSVKLILNGVSMSCLDNAPIYITKAAKIVIIVVANTENTFTDGTTYTFASGEDEPNAALYSKANMTIFGDGLLTVNGNYNDGITSKDGLIIKSANITVNAKDDGIRGKDYLITDESVFSINAGGDGIKSDNEDVASAGFISIESGNFTIISNGDAIYAINNLNIEDGIFSLTTGGGSSYSTSTSAKGLKAGNALNVSCETLLANCADDAIHSGKSMVINSGNFEISTSDDGIHADKLLEINKSYISIVKSYEGIESASITINDGDIHLVSSDDGINGAGGSTISTQYGNVASGNLFIHGGYICVTASGDGVDINGSITMTAGTLIVHGPTDNGNSAIDYDGTFKLTGGFLVAAGSSGMAQAPSASSTQYSLLANFTSAQQASTLINVQTTDGTSVLCFKPTKKYQSVAFSSPQLTSGKSYNIYLGGSTTGTPVDGLVEDGEYTVGTKYASFTVASIVTKVGTNGGRP